MSAEKDIETRVEAALKTRTVQQATEIIRSRFGTTILALISFLESALPVPILTDPFLIAAVMVNRVQAVRLVIITTMASVVGGVCAYFMAAFFFEFIQDWISSGLAAELDHLINGNESSTWVLTLVGAVTPVPYTLVAWVIALLQGGLLSFIIASTLGRGFRYVVVGYTAYKFGPTAISYAKRYIGITSIIVIILAALFFWIKM